MHGTSVELGSFRVETHHPRKGVVVLFCVKEETWRGELAFQALVALKEFRGAKGASGKGAATS